MNKISFYNDYSYLAHPRILRALEHANTEEHVTYGQDRYSQMAAELLRKKANCDCYVQFISGGTQSNLINISHFLKPYESVISCTTGHIAVNETGAIEATGHKVHTAHSVDGKLTPEHIQDILDTHHGEHMVVPKMVYLSQSTETGSIYTRDELKNISDICKENSLYLYVDGARIASALASPTCDFTLSDIASFCDAFYFGGTKIGLLFGEATVICNDALTSHYRHSLKQRGGLLAKGASLGVQFYELLKDDLYIELATHANKMANRLYDGIVSHGFTIGFPCQSNQIFVTLPTTIIEKLEENFSFLRWTKDDNGITIRLVTSWSTKQEDVDQFIDALGSYRD